MQDQLHTIVREESVQQRQQIEQTVVNQISGESGTLGSELSKQRHAFQELQVDLQRDFQKQLNKHKMDIAEELSSTLGRDLGCAFQGT